MAYGTSVLTTAAAGGAGGAGGRGISMPLLGIGF